MKGILSNALLSFRGTLIDGLLQPNVRLGNGLILEKADGRKAAKRIKEARAPKDVTRAQPEVYELRPPGMAGGGPRTEEHYMQTKIRTLTEREIALDKRRVALDKRRVALDKRRVALDKRRVALDKRRVALDKRRVELDNRRVALDKRRVALNNKETALDKREAALRKGQTAPIEREGALDSREAQFSLKHRQLVEKQQRLLSQTQSTPNQQTDQPALDAKSSLYEAKVIFKLRNKALITKRKLTGKILPPVRSKSGKPAAAATSDLESSIQPSISPNSKFESASDYDEIFPGLDDNSSSDSRTRIMLPRRPAP
ncbi:hypothetical protein SLS60_001169 [Paraconiothyrium brasiliense]|uniref:Uncharacterized protein n=1 Tax=Paraconiothyrium brasiliense TaxID=300254 RepID=A0ABR3S8C0_9PLEO